MPKLNKILTSLILICFLGGLVPTAVWAQEIPGNSDISELLTQTGTDTGDKNLFDAIQSNKNNSITSSFKSWAKSLEEKHEKMKKRANEEMKKIDTLEETIEINKLNEEIITDIESRLGSTTNQNELAYLEILLNHYGSIRGKISQLSTFNELYEFLLIMAGEGADVAGTTKDNQTLRREYQEKSGELNQETTQTSDIYTNTEQPGYTALLNNNQLFKASNTTANYLCQLYSNSNTAYAQTEEVDTTTDQPVHETGHDVADPNADRKPELPPELDFSDPLEKSILLPATYEEAMEHINKGETVDPRVYFFLYNVLQQMRAGQEEDEENYLQKAATPNAVETICGAYEDDPQECKGPQLVCGLSQTAYALEWLFGEVDNIGTIFGDRTHLRIWLGLNAPEFSDEYNKNTDRQSEEETGARNPHREFKAVDISAIGLYNERLDCAACKGLEACPPDCLLLATPVPQCCPVLPLPLDNAVDALVPVEVKWSHESITDDLLANAAEDLLGNIIDPDLTNNGFHIKSLLGLMAKNAFNQLIGGDLKNFDFFSLLNGTFEDFMLQAGNSILQENIFGQLGFPENFLTNFNWKDPKSFFTTMASGYLGEAFGLPGSMMTPLLSATMSGDFKAAALSALNLTTNLNIPPNIRNYMDIAIQNADNPKAIGLAFANIGMGQVSNIMGWPTGTLDINDLSGQGFTAIANRLSTFGLSKVSGLPSDFIVDIENPQNTLSSLSSSLLSKSINNYEISNFVTQTITSGETPTLNSVLKQFSPDDIASLLNLGDDKIDLANEIYNYVQNPESATSHIVWLNKITDQVDLAEIASANPYFNESAIKTIIEKGTSPQLGDEMALTSIATQILFEKSGIEISEADFAKIPYLVKMKNIQANQPISPNPAFTNPIFGGFPGVNPQNIMLSPELQTLNNQFIQEFGGTENLTQFSQRITNTINNSEESKETIRDLENYSSFILVRFTNTPALKDFFEDRNDPTSDNRYDYIDTVQLPTRGPNNSTTYLPTSNILKSVGIDINKVEISPLEEESATTPTTPDMSAFSSAGGGLTIPASGITYIVRPKVNLADMLIPGNTDSTNNEIGKFNLLESLTDVINYSFDRPIEITIYPEGETPPTTNNFSQLNQSAYSSFNIPTPGGTPTNPNLTDPNNPLRLAMNNKFSLPYLNPIGGYNEQPVDLLTNFGSTPAIFDAISQIGVDNTQAENLFTSIGQLQTASNLTGVNYLTAITGSFTGEDSTGMIKDLGNTMGLLEAMRSGNSEQGINTALGFMQQYQIMEKIAPTSWEIDSEGNLINQITDVTNIYADLKSGNYIDALQNIPALQDKFNALSDLGFDPNNLFSTFSNPSPDNISKFALDIASSRIASESGLEKLAAFEELTNIFGGFPPDLEQLPNKIPQLLQSDLFKENIFQDLDPTLLSDASDIFGLIQSGGDPKTIIQKFGTMEMFQNMVGSEKYSEFIGEYGGFINAALSGDPQAIAQTFMDKYSADINGWLSDQGLGSFMDMASLQGLINGDIESFAKNTAINYTTQLLSGDENFGQYSNLVNSVFNGEVPYKQIADIVINNFFSPTSDILCNASGSGDSESTGPMIEEMPETPTPEPEPYDPFENNERTPDGKIILPGYIELGSLVNPFNKNIKSFIEKISTNTLKSNTNIAYAAGFGFSAPGSLCDSDSLSFDNLKLQMTDMLKQMLIDKLTSLFSDAIFKKCKQKVATDNIIHFMDIALNFYDEPLAQDFFLVNKENSTGENPADSTQLVPPTELQGIRRFHPLQVFSDFTDEIFEKIEEKSKKVFSGIWTETRVTRINVFQQKCEERDNQFLPSCEDFIHFSW